jgi:hypothetical protein
MDDNQKAINTGLWLYAASVKGRENINSRVECVREFARQDILEWEMLSSQLEPIVNEWLAQNSIDNLLSYPFNIPDFKPLTRDEIYDDN